MKAISLWQPWASLWVAGIKICETRHWPTNHRGPLLVHAAKKLCADVDVELAEILVRHFGARWPKELPRGAIVGCVEISDCLHTKGGLFIAREEVACGNWEPGRYAWRARHAQKFGSPIPYIGRQGFFDVPLAIIANALLIAGCSVPPYVQTPAQDLGW